MPSWKPDCLKASANLTNLSQAGKLLGEAYYRSNKELDKYKPSTHGKGDDTSKSVLNFHNPMNKLKKSVSTVELKRTNGSQFGLTIAGGTDKDTRPRICDFKPNSIAYRSDELQIGDMITSINNFKTFGLKHEEIINLIRTAGDTLTLEFEYHLPPWPIHPSHVVNPQTIHIQLEKEQNSYGFTLRGGRDDDVQKSRPLIVTHIRSGGSADREGTLKIGDRIIAVNGINVANATLREAYAIIKQCKGLTLFLIEYDSAIVDSIKNANGPLLIEIEKSPGSSIGIRLKSVKDPCAGKNQILVDYVKPASIADRCGAIYVGDQILSLDDVNFEHLSLEEATQILDNCTGEFSRIEILPLSQVNPGAYTSQANSKSLSDLNKEYRLVDMQKYGSLSSFNGSSNVTQIKHSERVAINLKADDNGTFGFTLQGSIMTNERSADSNFLVRLFPQIGYVEPGSPAERSGLIHPGDRIINVNDISIDGLSLEEARRIIQSSGPHLKLEIEFDVADSIMLKNGTFQVKLLKKNMNLGIKVAYPSKIIGSSPDERYPVISAIKKGSIAYRSGMLVPGDIIQSVNNVCIKNKSIDEINHILKTISDEVVELQMRKPEEPNIDSSVFNRDSKIMIFNVDIKRNGGPLGLTISGSDDRFEPMFVSALSEGGLAESTGSIQVGDIILAINNVDLRGKSLTEAIQLLQNGDDLVTLQISRRSNADIYIDEIDLDNFQKEILNVKGTSSPIVSSASVQSAANQHNVNSCNRFLNQHPTGLSTSVSRDSIRKAISMESINAVERELDEVLKDLELNSQKLCDQLESHDANAHNNNNNNNNKKTEIPVYIKQNKVSTLQLNIDTDTTRQFDALDSGVTIENIPKENADNNSSISISNKPATVTTSITVNTNGNATNKDAAMTSRQNIVSTYELCHECFNSNFVMSNSQCNHHQHQSAITDPNAHYLRSKSKAKTSVPFKDRAEDLTSARMKLKPTTDAYNPPSTSTTTTITTTTATTPSYHDSSKKSDSPSAYPIYTKSSYRDLDEQSDTQTTSESSNSHKSSNKREETKLDKLPPVPPSSLFTSSLRRRAQQNQMMLQSQTQNRLLNNNDSKFHSEFSIFNRQNSQFSPNSLSSNNNNNNSNEASQLSESERQMATATRESNSNHANDRVEVTLFKDHKYKDFGFYVADSPNGLIVKKVRENGPADNNEHIRPNCKILKVNKHDFTQISVTDANRILFNEYCSYCPSIVLTLSAISAFDSNQMANACKTSDFCTANDSATDRYNFCMLNSSRPTDL